MKIEKENEKENLPSRREFEMYERVRQSGKFNMFDPRAIAYSGLSKERYWEVLKNYSKLMKLYPGVRAGRVE